MTEQLNERDMWLLNRGYDYGLYDGRNDSEGSEDNGWDRFVLEKLAESAPVNPNSARITELEREVERLGGLLDNLWCLLPVPLKTHEQAVEFWTAAGAILKDNNLDSSRTAERNEWGDG